MTNLESFISRYLDGELGLAEQEKLRHLLSESAEARMLLHEMTAVKQAARRTPALHAPGEALQERLFQRLYAEGLYADKAPLPARKRRPAGLASAWKGAMVTALLLVALIGGGYWMSDTSSIPSPVASTVTPEVSAPKASAPGVSSHSAPDNNSLSGMTAGPREAAPLAVATIRRREPQNRKVVATTTQQENITGDRPFAFSMAAPDELEWEGMELPTVVARDLSGLQKEDAPFDTPVPRLEKKGESPSIAASIRGGTTYVDHGAGASAQEVSFRIGVELGGGHQLAFVGGSGPALTETRHTNTGIMLMAQYNEGISKRYQESAPAEHKVELHNEAWMGVGYRYTFPARMLPRLIKDLQVDVAANAGFGTGTTAFRVGGELVVSRKITDGVAIEGVVTVSNVTPRDREIEEFTIFDSPDAFVYNGATQNQAFVSYGVQLGVRVDIK